MAKILPVTVVGWQHMKNHWWQFVLIGIILATVSIGCLYVLYSTIKRLYKFYKLKSKQESVSPEVAQRLADLSNWALNLSNTGSFTKKPASFGVYLGGFTNPPTEQESQFLSQWEILIVDPFQNGVRDAIVGPQSTRVLGRIDLRSIISTEISTLEAIERVAILLVETFSGTAFHGLLLAQWEHLFSSSTFRKLLESISSLGLAVYIETRPPKFLEDKHVLQTNAVSGIVIRNAAILPNGEKRDYFQMTELQSTIKAFVSQACLRDFDVMAWETINDDAILSNAVLLRGIQWCNFYSAITWVGTESALKDVALNMKVEEPLSAFGWLKDTTVMKVHDLWRSSVKIAEQPTKKLSEWEPLMRLFPCLEELLFSEERQITLEEESSSVLRAPPGLPIRRQPKENPLSISPSGEQYSALGCFPLGSDVSPIAFSDILQSQQLLKHQGLLHPVHADKLHNIGVLLNEFHQKLLLSNWIHSPELVASIKELSNLALNGVLRVNLGLDSGFRKSTEVRFWSIYEVDSDGIEIFVSKSAKGFAGTVLHTYLSAQGYPRHVCFEAEVALATFSKDLVANTELSRRLVQDIELLTPEERLLLLQHLMVSDGMQDLTTNICSHIQKQLIEVPCLAQIKDLNTVGYLDGTVTEHTLIASRIDWYRDQGRLCPSFSNSSALFSEINSAFTRLLKERREGDLETISKATNGLINDSIDSYTDILLLSIFCAARKSAFEEIYIEVTDRNPLFNNQADQAAAFAESFALGSRCEAYFDVSPSVFGKLLSDRFRAYYGKHQPPTWINGAPELATAYAGAQIDVNPDDKVKPMPGYQRFTFLSVFALPALIDIILLTITGRGLYLSAFMTFDEQRSATIALMISLLLSGAIGTWISSGGSYYLISMAFSAMNMFILVRFIAGIAFTIAGGLLGFIVISGVKGPRAGIVFYLYLIALTAYLTLFASIACYSFPGSQFLSGRKIIIGLIPLLFISPIVSTFTNHDSVVYLVVLYIFVGALLLGLRSIGSRWVRWYQDIRRTDDSEIRKWYLTTHCGNDKKAFEAISDPAALKLSREALHRDVLAECGRSVFSKPSADRLVSEIAKDWNATNFLLDWYCRYSDVPRPVPFSSSWNIQTKVALDTLRNAQKGIRLHNAFIHWRQASKEIGCGVLYFIIALLDKWVELLCGGSLIGLSASLTDSFRMAVGFGLAYYLTGAVLIDTKAQHLHELINSHQPVAIRSAKEIRDVQKRDVQMKRRVYWKTLLKFLMWHVWSLALTSSLLWTFQASLDAMIMFYAYVLAYTGLLWYQYTKIFSGPHALRPLFVAVVIGLPVGIALKSSLPEFAYSSVIGLGTATWSVAILSIWTAKMGMPKKVESPVEPGKTFHAYSNAWSDQGWSQQELQTLYDNLLSIPSEDRVELKPETHPGVEIKSILLSSHANAIENEAFPNAEKLISWTIAGWEKGSIALEFVPIGKIGSGLHALSCAEKRHLTIKIGIRRGLDGSFSLSSDYKIAAEILLHAAAEAILEIPHEYAILTGSLVTAGITETMSRDLQEDMDSYAIRSWANKELLKQLCLGFQADLDWDRLPKRIREVLVKRCLSQTCELTNMEWQWLRESLCKFDTNDLETHVSRCNLGARMALSVLEHAWNNDEAMLGPKNLETSTSVPDLNAESSGNLGYSLSPVKHLINTIGAVIKFFVTAMIADVEFQREFDYFMKDRPAIVRIPSVFLLNFVWTYAKTIQDIGLMFFLFHGRDNVKKLWIETKGVTITSKRNRVVVQGLDGTFTAFRHDVSDGGFKMVYYSGECKNEPQTKKQLSHVSIYSKDMLLLIKQEFKDGELRNEYHYDYHYPAHKEGRLYKDVNNKLPLGRRCVKGDNHLQNVQYNRKGLIEAGSYIRDGNLIRFKYHYRKNPKFGDELLRAEFVLAHISCTVSWCAPPRRHPEKIERWIPHAKITEASFVQGPDVYESKWLYDHKFHPTIFTTLNGRKIQTPPLIENDHLGVLAKPKNTSFVHDNPLSYCNGLDTGFFSRALGFNKQRFPVSTSHARSLMWKAWKERAGFDGVIVRWMDERLLRRDRVLAPYWRYRNRGNLEAAKKYLDLRADAVMASADLDDNISSWTPLAVKISDLFNFGPGGDAVAYTRSKDVSSDTNKTLHVMAADNGTWPNEGGGVSACRRDMINSLRTIKWHMICESAHDFGIPKHQTEQNIQSLKVIPLWGLDFLTPTHGLFKNKLDSEVDNTFTSATEVDIKRNFIPILTALVKGSRAISLSNVDIQQATRALVNLNSYFQASRHWSQVWTSELVKESWRELWLTQEMANAVPSSKWFDTELPTLGHLNTALELWFRYLFIFSIPVPEKVPIVFQASHHSVSASYGVVCKIKRNCTLQIWDHAISWRETNLCLSSALCKLPPFVRNSLLGLMRLTSVLVLHHADIVSPCADFFNPGWEVEIGTSQGAIEHRNSFRRKVDPIVNGITDMQKFAPVKEIKSQRPTVTMLSHVWYAKDIKIAILAADIIINQWGFDDYYLDIYGAIDKMPTYSTECQELIASKGLRGRVMLRGTADPMKVLENTWLFLNSSLSEGLPLALGEAALTGAPVVCTDVGASLRVLSDPDDFSRFSAVVAPNDAQALARAQISMLAMLGEWSQYADDKTPAPSLSSSPSPEDVAIITQRMYDKREQRRKLGMMTRGIVQKSFSGDRYLREHEQMLWIGKSLRSTMIYADSQSVDPVNPAAVRHLASTADQEIMVLPPSAINSWRSSAESGLSTLYTDYSGLPRFGSGLKGESIKTGDSNESTDAEVEIRLPSSKYLPVFAPGRSGRNSDPSGSRPQSTRNLMNGLQREELLPYRNSDISTIMRDDFLNSMEYLKNNQASEISTNV
ncbi:glycosyl transferase, group 1 family protein [Paecilomyces variotii No. 5]|uniref:Glycosyl transferase, group 1 family protein n=1 Tax=Byssochlamys spectabilis (strain No. 5 / NBRC 109023) TaxID=1356009 RepID=V5FYP2_BYSSN|nr:glycosyl transferase, group 1 family protein [Paecilomyces variotii No. 5]